MNIKAGDKIKCTTDRIRGCTKGNIYAVTAVESEGYVHFVDDDGDLRRRDIDGEFVLCSGVYTRGHDYSGCPSKIAEAVSSGREILCNVWDDIYGRSTKAWVYAYNNTSNSTFKFRGVTEEGSTNVWRHAEVVDDSEITLADPVTAFRILIADGWEFDSDGDLVKEGTGYLLASRFSKFGTTVSEDEGETFPKIIHVS